jgi:DNA oxidative demethylase
MPQRQPSRRIRRIAGFLYKPDLITAEEHESLACKLSSEPFTPLHMRGQITRRSIVSYGLSFLPHLGRLPTAPPIPDYLHPLRRLAADVASVKPAAFQQALITRYPKGSEIGWHVDHSDFGDIVVVVSFGSPATLFLRERSSTPTEHPVLPRSVYVLANHARWNLEHRVVAHGSRYSVAFRTLPG